MKEHKHFGAYALIIKDDKIVLIKKKTGPYDGKLDLPGGTIEFGERPEDTLVRELEEEIGVKVKKYELVDANSVAFKWKYEDKILNFHHVGIFYKVLSYDNEIKKEMKITDKNDDSLGADFYTIKALTKDKLSDIAILELEKLGYKLN